MEQNSAQQIEKRLAELPSDVQAAVLSVEWEQKVRAVAQKHGLHIDQTGILGDITLMAMLGMLDLAEYPQQVARDLALPADKAAAVASDINNDVFTPIRESLKSFTSRPKEAPAAPITAMPNPTIPATPELPPIPEAKPLPKPDLAPAEKLLEAKTVSVPPANPATAAPQPKPYTADPYREPPTP